MYIMIGKKIKSQINGITGTLIQESRQGMFLTFSYEGKEVKLPFRMLVNEQTAVWIETICEMMIDNYIEKIQNEKKMDLMFSGGVSWDEQ